LNAFRALCAKNPGRCAPLCRCFLADTLTPVEAFRRLGEPPYGFLLESVERGEQMGRYSFVGCAPEIVFSGDFLPKPVCRIERPDGPPVQEKPGDPLAALEEHLAAGPALPPGPELGVPPFACGAVGYVGYDLTRVREPRLFKAPPRRRGLPGVPDMLMPVYRTVLAFDHVRNLLYAVHYADPREGGVEAAYWRGAARLSDLVERLLAPGAARLCELESPPQSPLADVDCNFRRQDFSAAVVRAKDYIAAGDAIQIVLSQRFSRATAAAPFEVYRRLRAINPSPYMFFLRAPQVCLVGSSPEVMVRVEQGRITLRPIAGTRPRGSTPEQDAALTKELLADPKERAEHAMLLDLGRNDVGRVSNFGSVIVTEQMVVEHYSHVMHIVSNVTGRLRDGLSALEALRACHPAGTVSGAPKLRAMEIIDELEPDSRGPYAGAVGVLDLHGNLNTAITIRTIAMVPRAQGGYTAHVQAGAGIVADSEPEREHEETRNKALALLRALEAAERP
jgi:anthranilate synthase component 1